MQILLLALLTLLAYAPVYRAGFIWDDDLYIEANPVLTAPDGLARIWFSLTGAPHFYPLVFTTFWIERRLWGLNPMGYHIVNVAIHIGVSILLWAVLRRLRIPLAYLAALAFALHPVAVESVAWVTERKNTLSAFFYLASLLTYIRFARLDTDADPASPAPKPHWPAYPAALALFTCAILSKTITCSLPAAILLIIYWKRASIRIADILPLLPMFAIGLAGAAATVWVERHHVRTVDLDLGLSPIDRVLIAGRAAWFYLGKVFLPSDLAFIYTKWTIDPRLWWQFLYPAAGALLITALFLLRRRIGRGPLVAALFFAGTLLPALGFFDIYPMRYSYVADHFQYLAMIGPIALAAAIAARLLGPAAANTSIARPTLWLVPAAALIGILGLLTARQTLIYHSRETLWRDTVQKSPDAWMAHNNLGGILCQQGNLKDGMAHFHRALEINPRHAMALCNLALAHFSQGDLTRADSFIQQALDIDRSKPLILETAARIADVRGQPSAAADLYLAQADILATRPAVRLSAGSALARAGRHQEAADHLQRALATQSTDFPLTQSQAADALVDLAASLVALGRHDQAGPHLDEALRLAPDHRRAQFVRAALLASSGRTPEAITRLEAAISAGLADPDAFALLGQLHLSTGAPTAPAHARHWFTEALRLNPDHRQANLALGRLLAAEGNTSQATSHFLTVLRSNPADPEAAEALQQVQRR